MSDWTVHLIKIGEFVNHTNSDTLAITQVYGQNVIFKRGTFIEGDLAVFLPPDTCMPMDPEHPLLKDNAYLKPGGRVDAVRLRGVFSNGFLVPARVLFTEEEVKDLALNTDISERVGVTKYEDPGDRLGNSGENEKDHGYMFRYTDIENWAKFRHKGIIKDGEDVVILEKLHGCNARFAYREDRLWVGSRTCIKAQYVTGDGEERNLWWKVAKELNLEAKFKNLVNEKDSLLENQDLSTTVLYGEVYGQVQDLKYGVTSGAKLRIFDTYDHKLGRYNDWEVTVAITKAMGLETVPVLYTGAWKPELEELRNGPSLLYPGHTREGFVIKPLVERFICYDHDKRGDFTDRVIYKLVGEDYKTRKRKVEILP